MDWRRVVGDFVCDDTPEWAVRQAHRPEEGREVVAVVVVEVYWEVVQREPVVVVDDDEVVVVAPLAIRVVAEHAPKREW